MFPKNYLKKGEEYLTTCLVRTGSAWIEWENCCSAGNTAGSASFTTAGNGAGSPKDLTETGNRACIAASQTAQPMGNCLSTGNLFGTAKELRGTSRGMWLVTAKGICTGTPTVCWGKPERLPPKCALAFGSAVATAKRADIKNWN